MIELIIVLLLVSAGLAAWAFILERRDRDTKPNNPDFP